MLKQKSNNEWNDSILILASVILLVLVGGGLVWLSGGRERGISQSQAPKILGKAILTIDFGDNTKRSFEGDIVEGETLFDVLTQAAKAGNFSYQVDEGNNLSAIESFSKNNKQSWQYYVNGKKVGETLNSIILQAGDEIVVKYAK